MKRVSNFVDQGLISIASLLCNIAVARVSAPSDYGAFGIAFGTYLVLIGVSRAFTGDVAIVFGPKWRRDEKNVPSSIFLALILGALEAMAIVLIALFLGGDLQSFLLVTAAALPFLVAYDAWRMSRVSSGRLMAAIAMDLAWVIVVLLSIVLATALPVMRSPLVQYVIWLSAGAALGAATLLAQVRYRATARNVVHFVRTHRSFSVPYAVDYLLMFGASQLILLVLTAATSLSAAAGVRGAQTILGVVNVVLGALAVVMLREISAMRAKGGASRDTLTPALTQAAAGLSLVGIAFAGAVGLPQNLGEALFGPSWELILEFMLPLAVAAAFAGASLGATTALRAMALASTALRVRYLVAPIAVGATLIGFFSAGLSGALAWYAGSSVVNCMIWWGVFMKRVREESPSG